jgi:LAS superfamily LD-carboxypeptidase LdcB
MPHQQQLCQADAACRGGSYGSVAQPGTSNHQMGLAIDFAMPHVKGGQSCATRGTVPNNAAWNWLRSNAAKWGFRQYSGESWHWDVITTANRC